MAEKQILMHSAGRIMLLSTRLAKTSAMPAHLFAGLRFFDDQKDVASILVQGLDATGLAQPT